MSDAPTLAARGTSVEENRKLYDEWAPKYEADTRSWGYNMPEKVAEAVKEAVQDGAVEGLEVLDAGMGDGLSGKAMSEAGFKSLVGMDLSPELVKLARKAGIYKQADVADLSKPLTYSDNAFDVVICVGVLTYLEPESGVLTEFCRVAKPGGLICYTNRTDKVDKWASEQAKMEADNKWEKVKITEPLPYLPGNPEFGENIKVIIHLYRVK